MMDQAWLERISQIQRRAVEDKPPIRPTEVFNEGWMLRLVLDWMAAEGQPDHPLYNTVRPHRAHGGLPPAPETIKPSPWFGCPNSRDHRWLGV